MNAQPPPGVSEAPKAKHEATTNSPRRACPKQPNASNDEATASGGTGTDVEARKIGAAATLRATAARRAAHAPPPLRYVM